MQIAAQVTAERIDNQSIYNQSWTSYKPGAGCNDDERYMIITHVDCTCTYINIS